VAVGWTQPLTEMSTRNISWGGGGGKGGRCIGLTEGGNLHVAVILTSGSRNHLELWGPVQACTGITLPFLHLPVSEAV
jgi:hypothetical protein